MSEDRVNHDGEYVLSAAMLRGEKPSGIHVTVNVTTSRTPREIANEVGRQLRRMS